MKTDKIYNIIIAGVGGQGLITLLQIISQIAFNKGLQVRTSELHGLSQRGGSVSTHIRFGREVYSPIVLKGKVDFVLALEYQESLCAGNFANKNTIFVVNEHQTPTLTGSASKAKVESDLRLVSKKVFFMPGSAICEKEFKTGVVAGIFLLGWSVSKRFLPLTIDDIKKAIGDVMPEKYQELNLKVIDFAKNYEAK